MNHEIEVEPARSLALVEEAAPESSLAAVQFEAIIRAWKGEAVGPQGAVLASPVGEVDWDGSLAFGQLGMNGPMMYCTDYTLWGSLGCSWECTQPVQFTCPTSPYGPDCQTIHIECTVTCSP